MSKKTKTYYILSRHTRPSDQCQLVFIFQSLQSDRYYTDYGKWFLQSLISFRYEYTLFVFLMSAGRG